MDYVNGGDAVVARLDSGERVLDSLATVRSELNIECSFPMDIDAVNAITLGHYDVDDQECLEKEFTGQFEAASFFGNISPDKTHTHTRAGTRDSETLDGHCPDTHVSGTFEVVIHLGEAPLTHHLNERTGLDVFGIQTGPDRAEPD